MEMCIEEKTGSGLFPQNVAREERRDRVYCLKSTYTCTLLDCAGPHSVFSATHAHTHTHSVG